MVKYVYYDSTTGQVEAEFDTTNLSIQENWAAKGLLRAVVLDDFIVTRNHRVTVVDEVVTVAISVTNPVQATPRVRTRLDELQDKLSDDSMNPAEMREMLRLERNL